MKNKKDILFNGIYKDNPIFVQLLGMCPTLAVTTSATNGFAMGMATLFVLVMSNIVVAMLRNFIPKKVRIPSFIVVIATFVTIAGMVMEAYLPAIYDALGLFIPLIVVNCLILGRAESYAYKNTVFNSILDGLGMGAGFTIALVILGAVREILGAGSIFGFTIFGAGFKPMLVMILPPGAFLALGILMAINKSIQMNRKAA